MSEKRLLVGHILDRENGTRILNSWVWHCLGKRGNRRCTLSDLCRWTRTSLHTQSTPKKWEAIEYHVGRTKRRANISKPPEDPFTLAYGGKRGKDGVLPASGVPRISSAQFTNYNTWRAAHCDHRVTHAFAKVRADPNA
eukprot:CAMPEP_0174375410 /NCGR_PEP_ID=MMETSP0811_2-20130205/114498_1 /TAXON_ID=73025 ORGANISM="Eutreptiella gymnastica-like, Strain CCMP1594" /NCGR_SAMPLE_ID=MMETSP0811_2 /ASSEMBLY_ACC=CAM_ASM_000667 /LENGTH=138 /DNA_ID=CAMNT_0015525607 /DNA_START=539 /DNA_END=956 /DNA_ORIENTATION=-